MADQNSSPEKKKRKRFKKLYSQIRDQMEFYFSDSNLSKDRFLKQKVSENDEGYVDLDTFANFNKLKQLTSDIKEVAKALSKSSVLQVSEDGTKVKRKTPVCQPKNVDEKTVYVECLPSTADHDWIKNVFSKCGYITYVSLPKYRTTGDIKGFAFVEFEDEKAADKACELLNNPPATAPPRPGWFPKGSKDFTKLEKKVKTQVSTEEWTTNRGPQNKETIISTELAADKEDKSLQESNKLSRKRKLSGSVDVDDHENIKPLKQMCSSNEAGDMSEKKLIKSENIAADIEPEQPTVKSEQGQTFEGMNQKATDEFDSVKASSKKRKCVEELEDKIVPKKVQKTSEDGKEVMESSKKKNRKRKRKDKNKNSDLPELRVIPKNEWLSLKKEYLALQKASFKQMKQTLSQYKEKHPSNTKVVAQGSSDSSHQKQDKKIEFVPGVIAKITAEKAMTRKDIKEAICQKAEVVYIDVLDGSNEGYIRCASHENAVKLTELSLEGYSTCLLDGDQEKTYWDKINSDRDKKLQTKSKSTKKRGRDKNIAQAEKITVEVNTKKHTFFED